MATGVEVSGYTVDRQEQVLTEDALALTLPAYELID